MLLALRRRVAYGESGCHFCSWILTVVATADSFLRFRPSTVFVVPLTSTPRTFPSHVEIEPDESNGLDVVSCALVEQMRAVSRLRCSTTAGNVGAVVSHQILDVLAMIVGMP